ncbi:MAG: hypothetical protein POELPBGB_02436 [Bacteroidia bacterium]|nr:hypothetical protein [Bacteroidia bacterium]
MPRNNNKIVSSTTGKIEKIIIRSNTVDSRHLLNNFYLGVRAAFGSKTVIGISQTIELNQKNISALNKKYPHLDLPDTPEKVAISFMGNKSFRIFSQKNSKNKNFEAIFNNNSAGNEDKETIAVLINEIIRLSEDYILNELQNNYPNGKFFPKISIDVNLSESPELINGNLMGWVQDIFVAVQNKKNKKITAIYSDDDTRILNSIQRLKEKFGKSMNYLPVKYTLFEGGNILASENFVIIGRKILELNFQRVKDKKYEAFKKEMEADLRDKFRIPHIIWSGFKKGRVIPGSEPQDLYHQPLFHIDLYILPSGQTKIVKGIKHSIIFIGKIDTKYYSEEYLKVHNERKKIIKDLNNMIRKAKSDLSDYSKKNKGKILPFVFIEIPLFVEFDDFETSLNRIDEQAYKSFLNAHVEVANGNKTIYLPAYKNTKYISDRNNPNLTNPLIDVEKGQIDAAKIYSNLGYKVIFTLPNANEQRGGALHCYSKVISRAEK